jgi:hypothetical protein
VAEGRLVPAGAHGRDGTDRAVPGRWTGGRDLGLAQGSLGTIPAAEAVEICRDRILAAHASNKRAGGTLAYFAQVLADEAVRRRARPAPVAPAPLPDPGSPEFGRIRDRVQERVRPETFVKFFADLTGRLDGEQLVVVARDKFRRDFVEDNYRNFIVEMASAELGGVVELRIEIAGAGEPSQAAGGAGR